MPWHSMFGIICRKRTRLAASLVVLACLLPLRAQVDPEELENLNFKLGGGVSVPTNPIGRYLGLSGNVVLGAGANVGRHNSFGADFMWSGLSPEASLIRPSALPIGSVNVYAITGNYQYSIDSISASPLGVYVTVGGGWYDRRASVRRSYTIPPATVCQPVYNWWGYACDAGGFVSPFVVSRGASAGGVNGGIGFTVKLRDTGWKLFAESRYHYAWTRTYPITLVPISIGVRFN